jgi:fluoride exporter
VTGSRTRPSRAGQPGVLLVIALGGALGTLLRYGMSRWIHVAKDGFPWATFWTNISGAFVLGWFGAVFFERSRARRYARPFFAIGFLGAYTTFSTMAVETVTLCKDGHPVLGIAYLLASVWFGLTACYLGIVLARLSPFGAGTAPR